MDLDKIAAKVVETGGKAASVKVAKELVKIARELVGAGELYYASKEGFVKLTLWKHDGKESYLVSEMDRSALIPADKDTKFKGTDWSIPADRLDEKARQEGWRPTTLAQIKQSISRKSPF